MSMVKETLVFILPGGAFIRVAIEYQLVEQGADAIAHLEKVYQADYIYSEET